MIFPDISAYNCDSYHHSNSSLSVVGGKRGKGYRSSPDHYLPGNCLTPDVIAIKLAAEGGEGGGGGKKGRKVRKIHRFLFKLYFLCLYKIVVYSVG